MYDVKKSRFSSCLFIQIRKEKQIKEQKIKNRAIAPRSCYNFYLLDRKVFDLLRSLNFRLKEEFDTLKNNFKNMQLTEKVSFSFPFGHCAVLIFFSL